MNIMLGNLSIADMEHRLGVEFPEQLKERLAGSQQAAVNGVKLEAGKWHCFDIPFMLLCGGESLAEEVVRELTPLAEKFKISMHVGVQ